MLHPFLTSTSDPFNRLCRAHFWLSVDADPAHAEYWRAQVVEAEGLLLEFLSDQDFPERRAVVEGKREALRGAALMAWERAARVPLRRVVIPC